MSRVEYDFPCSWSFRQLEAELNGETLPGIEDLATTRAREDSAEIRRCRAEMKGYAGKPKPPRQVKRYVPNPIEEADFL